MAGGYGSSGCLVVDRRFAMAKAWLAEGDRCAAIELLEQTVPDCPDWPPLHFTLGEWLMEAGEAERAIAAFRRYLELDAGDRMGAIIKLSLLGAAPRPAALPEEYVEALFDQYAPRFDRALVERLAYNVPMALRNAIDRFRAPRGATERILDLGCGTGLAGEAFFERAAWLEGVDLSTGMLSEAENKRIFNRLCHAEALSFLNGGALGGGYDLIVAADVLVYMGDLEPLLQALVKNLHKDGLFAFSVQCMAEGDYLLGADHRFAHSRAYLERALASGGMCIVSCEQQAIRMDGGREIVGLIVVAMREDDGETWVDPALLTRLPRDRSGMPT
ncbi:MAG: methyltransferase domain-containing protein [Alphaproteobacteria bacterium]|nr:methyltransferase domain-containing protein [Alphaproteobacteria bacterium]